MRAVQTTYVTPLYFFPRVAIIRSAIGKYVTIANEPPRDETEPPELHVTDTTPGSMTSGVAAALPDRRRL